MRYLFFIFIATSANAQMMCAPADQVIAGLKTRYHERSVMELVIEGSSSPMVLYRNEETGSWTLLSVNKQSNTACIAAGGMKSQVSKPGEPI